MRKRSRLADDTGSELVELAVVLPILVLIIAGIIDFGFLFQRYEVVTNAAREGARLGSLADDYTNPDIISRVRGYLDAGGLDGTSANVLPGTTTQTIGTTPVLMVTVTVQYPTQLLYIGPSILLQATATMRQEGGS